MGPKKETIWPKWDPFYIKFVASKMPALRFWVKICLNLLLKFSVVLFKIRLNNPSVDIGQQLMNSGEHAHLGWVRSPASVHLGGALVHQLHLLHNPASSVCLLGDMLLGKGAIAEHRRVHVSR